MYSVSGKISDKIRNLFTMKDGAMTYRRPSREESKPMPKDGSVKGIKLSSGYRRTKK